MSAGDKADFTVRLIDKVSGAARSAGNAISGLGRAFTGGAKAAGGADGAVGGFASTVAAFAGGNLLAGVIEKGVEAFISLGETVIETTAHLVEFGQNAELAFNQLAKHGVKGEQLFEHSSALAMRFGLDLEETTHQYETFLALQFSPKAIDGLVRAGADMKSLGSSAEDVQGIFTSLAEIKSIGSLQGRQLLMLENHRVSGQLVRESIGEHLGKSVEEVNKMMHAGKISAEVGIAGIEEAIRKKLQEKNLGDAGAKFADNTIDGIYGKFKATAEVKGLEITKVLQQPLTDLAKGGFDKLQGFLDSPAGASTVQALQTGLKGVLDVVIDLGKSFGKGFGDTFHGLYEGAKPFLGLFTEGDGEAAVSVIGTLAEEVGKAAALAVGFGLAFAGVAGAFAEVGVAAVNVGEGIVHAITDPLFAMVGNVVLWWDNIKAIWDAEGMSIVEKTWDLGKNIVMGLLHGIESVIDYVPTALEGIADKAIAAVKDTFKTHSPSLVMADIGENVGLGLGMGISSTEDHVAMQSRGLALSSVGAMSDVMSTPPAWSLGPSAGSFDYGPVGASSAAQAAPAGAAAGPRGDFNFSPMLNVTVEGGAAGGNAQELGDIIGDVVERRMEAWFRQLDMET
ncbi:MAG TPA: tape measure protein [Polyangiaceae bacterium]|jgi:tape measure domain-containing protein|nr:tape measure protein [Polyangiaceae bacterium]